MLMKIEDDRVGMSIYEHHDDGEGVSWTDPMNDLTVDELVDEDTTTEQAIEQCKKQIIDDLWRMMKAVAFTDPVTEDDLRAMNRKES